MEKSFIKRLETAYDIKCPLCGSKPYFVINANNTLTSHTCGHEALNALLEEREQLLYPLPKRNDAIKLNSKRADFGE
jgi:hypothetical protein